MTKLITLVTLLVSVLLVGSPALAFQNTGDELVGTVWAWQQTQDNSGQVITPPDPTRYTLEFLADGSVAVQADCNRGRGGYAVSANTLDIGQLATTLMACPAGSQDTEFLRQLDEIVSYLFQDGNLYLELPVDVGSMQFAPAEQAGAAAQAADGEAYIVQSSDWLSKIAEKQYGDPLAYPAIVEATNAKAAEDSSFAVISDPNMLEAGQKLWLPAAPQNQAAVGIYKALLPAASSPGIDSTLYLNIDNTVRLVEDYLNGEPTIVEVGNWRSAGSQVEVSLSGREGMVYDAPKIITFALDGDTLATTPDEDSYGSVGRRYLRFDALATGKQTVAYNPAEAAQAMSQNLAGIYKGFSPAASCCGLDWTLFLNPDNKASLKSDYLNGEAPIVEAGTWGLSDDTLSVTLADAQSPYTFQVADGVLVSNDFSIFGEAPLRLYRFDVAARNTGKAFVSGTISYLQRMALPPQAGLTVQLADVSRADAPAEVVSEQIIPANGQQVPFAFSLPYDPAAIDPGHTYAVQARIEADGKLLFITTRIYNVITRGNPTTLEVIVESVGN